MIIKKFLFATVVIAAIVGCHKTDNPQNNGGNEEPKPMPEPEPEYADLSLINYDGTPLTKSCTANCYIIRKDGLYSIPLVYGNAIKDGKTNEESFHIYGQTSFQDSYGIRFDEKSSPYIKDHASAQDKRIASAEVLWNDGAASIDNISVTDSELKFEVSDFSACNALIAVKDNDGTILWSWHLWITDADLTPVQITNADGEQFNVMPCNLGWNGWTADGKPTSPYFQWGRKDPFIANDAPSSYGNIVFIQLPAESVQDQYIAHQNPKTFYSCLKTSSWTTHTKLNFWDSKMSTCSTHQEVTKTIYDPCPTGWAVPPYNTFTGIKKTTITIADDKKGLFYQNLYLPICSRRSSTDATIPQQMRSYYWLSAPYNDYQSYALTIGPEISSHFYDFRHYGLSVRPSISR